MDRSFFSRDNILRFFLGRFPGVRVWCFYRNFENKLVAGFSPYTTVVNTVTGQKFFFKQLRARHSFFTKGGIVQKTYPPVNSLSLRKAFAMNVYIGSDHAGYELKQCILDKFTQDGLLLMDRGTYSSESVDYPDFSHAVAKAVEGDPTSMGIVICGSANGVSMSANKHEGIRCAICWNDEITELARLHNNANIIALPARFIDEEAALRMLEIFFSTEFEGGRHAQRVDKIPCGAN